jgi:hypothetical protein
LKCEPIGFVTLFPFSKVYFLSDHILFSSSIPLLIL